MNYCAFDPVMLRDERASLQATFLPAAGMLCCSLLHHGRELLAQNAGVAAYTERGKTMGIPLLYPWANRLSGHDYTVAGQTVTVPHNSTLLASDSNGLPIHGVIGGRMAWEMISVPRPDCSSLAARLSWDSSSPERFEAFPFRHDLHYQASLTGGRLEIEVAVHACGQDTVPVAFGFHPYLTLPGIPRERWLVDLPPMRHLELDADQIPTGPGQTVPGRRFELLQSEFDDGFDSLAEQAHFNIRAGELEISLEFLEGYRYAQVYTPRTGQFICFEPMTAPANALRSGVGLNLLAPGERYHSRFAVCVQPTSAASPEATHT